MNHQTRQLKGVPAARPLAIAHRAANDLHRLRAAESLGADYLECDVWLYQDRMEVRHEKTIGRLPIRWDRWSLEWRGPPRLVLEQLVAAWRGPGALLLDLKGRDERLPGRVLQAVGDAAGEVPFGVTARTWRLLEPFAEMPGVATFPSAGGARNIDALLRLGRRDHWTGIAIHRKLLSAAVVEQLHELAPLVTTWPVNDIETYESVMGYGVDGVTSDSLDVLAHVLSERAEAT